MDQQTKAQFRVKQPAKTNRSAEQQGQEQTSFSILYGQLVNGTMGLDPSKFQLSVPPLAWQWKAEDRGLISAAQYNFCSVMPEWSAVGSYVSSGAAFDTAYGQFLQSLAATSDDPKKQEAIDNAQQQMTEDASNLQDDMAKAELGYANDPLVVANTPSFTDWLATPTGQSYGTQISADKATLQQDIETYKTLLDDIKNPLLSAAVTAYSDTDWYSSLDNPDLKGFPAVPDWSTGQTWEDWKNSVLAGGSSVSIQYANTDQAYSFSNTWAQGSATIDADFFSLSVQGSWQRLDEFYTDTSLSMSIECAGLQVITISPAKWYSGTTGLANGPYQPGFSKQKEGSDTFMFGEGGVAPLMKTGMLVALNPAITCTVSLDTYKEHMDKWEASTAISIGPFTFAGDAGSTNITWTSTDTTATFKVSDTSNIPKILGCTVAIQPAS